MGCDEFDSTFEPKLSLFSLPNKLKDSVTATATMIATPPVGILASVPFQWEEVPGKPRSSCYDVVRPKSKIVRCLDLPPRLLNEGSNNNKIPSPTTVLDGPYLDHPSTLSLFRSRSLSSTTSFSGFENMGKRGQKGSRASLFGSGRRKNKDISVVDFSSIVDDDTKVKIIRFTRKSSFFAFSSSTSYFLTNIYESLKQVAPWKRRQRTLEK
ncbi:uncharacterized protein At4g00950 [Euphorbia lathyris]|uniref:uncharacterized protein At4g00950 n=1 Tax=Euphorbia lathyris TaxID=212925 RepID=UPI003313340B